MSNLIRGLATVIGAGSGTAAVTQDITLTALVASIVGAIEAIVAYWFRKD